MLSSGALGFILLFLLHPALGVKNLQNIISHLHDRYGVENQYALGINVPVRYCHSEIDLDQNFLPEDTDAQKVKDDMNRADRIYRGTRLIGARPKRIPGTRINYHSEYLLLINSTSEKFRQYDPLMRTLLNSSPRSCAIFFTLNSPCVNTCSTPNKTYSIIPALQMFRNLRDRHAFVFRQVWKHDVGKPEWQKNIIEIDKQIPIYRCDNNGCIRCVKYSKDKGHVVNDRCK